ncbi:PRC-barrel domain-containing protein [Pseudooceanicola sp.]|uniref:PRC-barrel domain-containing protein n=1 Tax=Pseudooceanicola sp. TaxID=1914328 RepID=UPI004058C563
MKPIAATSIALILMTGAAGAETHMSGDNAAAMDATANIAGMQGNLIRSRDITGGNIYTTNAAWDEGDVWDSSNVYDGVGTDWNDIGEIEDLILSRDGQLIGIVAEVGGFLDIADKHVAIAVEDVSLVAVDDQTYAYVTRFSEEELESMEGVDEGFWN